MCGPAGVAMMGVGALSSALSAQGSAKASQQQLNFQANLADINARVSESQAQQTLLAGQREEQKSRIATAHLKGSQRASMAANGVDLGVGSASQLLTSTDFMGEVDANTIKSNAIKSAWGYRVQASNQTAQAISSRGAADAISPNMAFTSSLLGSAGSVASSWYQYKKVS